jgi:hypothetical protein
VVSKNLAFLLVIIVMLVIGVLVGYGLGGGKVVTVTTTIPSPITIYTPYPTTVTTTITYTPTSTGQLIEAALRQVVALGPWRLAVLDAKEAKYIRTLKFGTWSYYEAPEGTKIIVITVRVENAGTDVGYPFGIGEISTPILVTDANKSYDEAYTYQLKSIYEVTKEIEQSAIEYRELDVSAKVAPSACIEGDFIYLIPATEKPAKVVMTYWPSPFEPKITVIIRLS